MAGAAMILRSAASDTIAFDPIAPVAVSALLLVVVLGFLVATMVFGRGTLVSVLRRGLIALALFGVAIGPSVYGPAEKTTFNSGNDVFIVLDTTGSVSAEDYNGEQTRLEGMRGDIAQIVEHFAGARFSLITFDAVALVRLPLTRDTNAVVSAVEVVQPEMTLYSHGSSISEPRELLADTLEAAQEAYPEHRRIVFYLGDGEQTIAEPPQSFADAGEFANAGLVLGYGTDEGGPMLANSGLYAEDDDEPEYIMDRSDYPYTVAKSTIDEGNLNDIADQLGIGYVHRTAPGAIPGIDDIENLADEALTELEARSLVPLYWVFALAAFALLLWEAAATAIALVNAQSIGRRA
jgi:Ca-activated chloride channel homolog